MNHRRTKLRPETEDDKVFLEALYATTRQAEMDLLPDWSEAEKAVFLASQFQAQSTYYAQQFADATFDVVELEGEPIGRLYVDRRDEEIRLIDIAVLPEHRGKGLGGELMSEILAEGEAKGLLVRIHVEQNNPAMHLYKRLGFKKIEDQGVYWLMEWTPKSVNLKRTGVPLAAFCVVCMCLSSCVGDDGGVGEPIGLESSAVVASGYDPATARALAIQSMKLTESGAAITALEQATGLAPAMVDVWLLLAGRRVEEGNVDGAFAALDHLTALGIRAPIDAYPPLQPLQADERWLQLVATLDAAVTPLGVSEVLFELEPKILRVDWSGVATDFLADDEVWGVYFDPALRHRRQGAAT